MAEILSQKEIDALLSALSTGEISAEEMKQDKKEKKVRVYDFKRPNKFSKEQLRTLNMIHENFARLLTTYLSAHLRTLVQINVFYVEQMSYYEFISSVPNPSIIGITDFNPLKGSGILEINPNIAFAIIDRLLGGPGEFEGKIRGLTEIETTIIEKVIKDILRILKDAWDNLINLNLALVNIETNAQFIQLIAPNETVALITFNGKIGKTEGMLNLCIPHILLEPIINKLSARYWFSDVKKESSGENIQQIAYIMKKSLVPININLGRSTITIRELLEIQKGDVIQLDKKVNEAVDVYIGSRLKFRGHPGILKNKMAVEITDIVEEVENGYE
ncbi:Flagellar motor switch protein FliM [Koleobacter methoxysyntrophicus]|uniref:Flagellar motor switch protein FliM n=1 Tax=Koleobacter methoxysyntrophicus TaxID=2751313 RepID=A0A8A0RPN6_9FIRM|nr:flagellar motor switch protein FliM [Koleobacter methoxysyntrophicus]QSQ09894.1 Flagellar motor switch protein FliM [Koleobacter methoxysyntrophicus]